jgi:hypothetical protein
MARKEKKNYKLFLILLVILWQSTKVNLFMLSIELKVYWFKSCIIIWNHIWINEELIKLN